MKKNKTYNILFTCFWIIIFFISINIKIDYDYCKKISILIVCLLIGCVGVWFIKYKRLNMPVFYFLLFSYFSWFGEFIIIAFNLEYKGQLFVNTAINMELLRTSIMYSIIGYSTLFTGALIFTKIENKEEKNNYDEIQDKYLKKATVIVAIIMITIGMPQFIYSSISKLTISFSESYLAIYNNHGEVNTLSNIITSTSMFFIPGIIMLIIACKKNKKIVLFCITIVIINLIISFASGGRGGAIVLALTFLWLYYSQIKKINYKKILILIILVFFIIKLFNVIAIYRDYSSKNMSTFMEAIEKSNRNNAIVTSIKEIGGNIFSLYHTIKIVPQNSDYLYGYSYFASIMAIFPSLIFGGYSFSKDAALAEWLMYQLNLDYGPGFTILAESYYNFGFLGFFAMFTIGFIYAKKLQNGKKCNDERILESIKISIFMYIGLITFRGTMLLIFRYYFYTILIPFLLISIIKNTMKKHDLYRLEKKNEKDIIFYSDTGRTGEQKRF